MLVVEKLDGAGLDRVFAADDAELAGLDEVLEDRRVVRQLRDRRIDGYVMPLSASEHEWLEQHYLGIRPFLCRVVAVGDDVPTEKQAKQYWWFALGSLLIGIALAGYSLRCWFRHRARLRAARELVPLETGL